MAKVLFLDMIVSRARHGRAAYVGNKLFQILLNVLQKEPVEQYPLHSFFYPQG